MRDVSRTGGRYAADLARKHFANGVVFGLPSQSGKICAAEEKCFRYSLQGAGESGRAGIEVDEGIQDSVADELHDVP